MAGKVDIDFRDAFLPTMEALLRDGALLVSVDTGGRPGGMTVSWAMIGLMWGRHILSVAVRPSRNTYRLIEESGDFTVNLLPSGLGSVMEHWGHSSGREEDKWAKTGLTPATSRRVRSPIVQQGLLHFECRVVHSHDLAPDRLIPDLVPAYYASGDYHRVFHGEILACYGV